MEKMIDLDEEDWLRQAKTILKKKFGYRQFRTGQQKIIQDVLNGRDVFAMMPTGSGKSLCYQIPGYMLNGTVLIVSPLLSLMEDQIKALRSAGEMHARALNGMMHARERVRVLRHLRDLRFLYISPEMLCRSDIREALAKIKISLFVVDEAHCVSQWGHEFRPDYLHLARIREQLGHPACLAVTATADERVREDIIRSLGLHKAAQTIMSVDRANIALVVREVSSDDEKMERLCTLLRSTRLPGIVYCASRDWTEKLAQLVHCKLGIRAAFYHGGMEALDRRKIQNQFLDNQLDLLCCTNAFGMGINKPDIRLVVHFHFPATMNAYLQEIGRVSRDGQQGLAVLYYSPQDNQYPEGFINSNFPEESFLRHIYYELDNGVLTIKNKDQFLNDLQERGSSETAARFIYERVREKPVHQSFQSIFKRSRSIIEQRRSVLLRDLLVMKNYLAATECRRTYYLNIYHESPGKKPVYCCDRCGISLADFDQANFDDTVIHREQLMNWKERLPYIFKEGDRSMQ
ncbi:RecQ family ATP-dependent DNA helicase [Sporolactobacillus shoreicorticis]|uniref:RecQ family ATP-dependent DNA helicase n=1 Tax=Sporolactobacillus shoreicorticis TaxID=1923877 RepID=A0ABW5S033_9BACL|nr:RecQ family ATP-dependent DNA helicase [Sporolactobacillus shoreicorticis]MCO7126745.1 RecQ family ATP-dependent DNA helicase [Sporolactobacillus shoreicorticis]